MEISSANTEPYYRFHLFNEEFNRSMKVAVGALEFVKKAPRRKQEGFLTILPTGGEPWGKKTKWKKKSVSTVVDETKRFLSHMGIVRVISAFEDFLITTEAEYDRFMSVIANHPRKANETSINAEPRFETVANLVNLDARKQFPLLPILDFLQIARNCIVHRAARASEALVEAADSNAFLKIVKRWRSERKKPLPKFPKLKVDQVIPFHPRHAILAAEICYRAARLINFSLAGILGQKGFIYMAAHHTLLAKRPIRVDARRSPDAVVNFALFQRYLVKDHNRDDTIAALKNLGKWGECRKAFNERFPSVK